MPVIIIILMLGSAFAALSLSASVQLILWDSLPGWAGILDIPILIALTLPLGLLIKEHLARKRPSISVPSVLQKEWALLTPWIILLLANLLFFFYLAADHPHGDWDAMATWNMHARFIFRGGHNWHSYLTPALDWSHPDYPLMIPAGVARTWKAFGAENNLATIGAGFCFTFLTFILLPAALSALRSVRSALLAGIILLGTPAVIESGASQYADIPLAFFYLATVVMLALRDHSKHKNACMYFAFSMAACAAWTKNEGLMFLLIAAIASLAVTLRHSGIKKCLKDSIIITGAAAPVLILLALFKGMTPQNDIMASLTFSSILSKVTDICRYGKILYWAGGEFVLMNSGLSLAAFAVVMLLGKLRIRHQKGLQVGIITILAIAAGFFAVFLLTPHDLTWHLATAMNRLILQLLPSALFVLFMAFDLEVEDVWDIGVGPW